VCCSTGANGLNFSSSEALELFCGGENFGKFSKKEAQVIKSHLTLWDLPHPIYKALPILKHNVNVMMNLNIHLDHKAMEGRRVLTLNR
jgi:hypothetical protein